MPFKFIHLTDTHLIGSGLLYGGDPAQRLARAVDSIAEEHADARFVAITGDLTHWGDPDAYAVLSRQLARLAMPVIPLVGNHDDTPAFVEAFPAAPRDEAGFVQFVLGTDHGHCLFLDTTEPGDHAGRYCATRRDWLAARLREADGPVFLFMHHPPFPIGIPALDAIMLRDADAFHETVAPHAARVRHIFLGHVHRAVFGNWRGMSFSAMRGLNHQVALELDPAARTIPGSFEPPAYGVVLVDDARVIVHLHDFTDPSPRFRLEPPADMGARAYALSMRHEGWEG
jgi:Icc protein